MVGADAYDLLFQLATAAQIQELLRVHKRETSKEVMVSGKKPELIDHLKNAVREGFIPFEEVVQLLQEAEENGDQHVFYFKPKTQAVAKKCKDGEGIAKEIWGSNWKSDTEFPKFTLVPSSYEWADFRLGLRKKPQDWIAKLYGHELSYRFVKQETLSDETLAKYYRKLETRTVCFARWNSPDLLELRVSRCDSKTTLLFRLNQLWTRLNPAFTPDDFVEWDLKKARRRMVEERKQNAEIYLTGSLQLIDSSSGKASFHPHTEDETADDAAERRVAIDAYVKANCACDHLVVTWLPTSSSNALEQELRVVIGGKYPHEVVIPAQTSSQGVDYVTNKLRYYGREES